jgi:hypothetical protein
MRFVDGMMQPGKISSVSGGDIDVTPVLGVDESQGIWCAWDSLGGNQRKRVCVAKPVLGRDCPPAEVIALNVPSPNICSPSLAVAPGGRVSLVWSEYDGNRWILKKAEHEARAGGWSPAAAIGSENDPRFCSACYDRDGKLWVACSVQGQQGAKVTASSIEPNAGLGGAAVDRKGEESGVRAANVQAARRLKELIDGKYSYRDLRGIDWNALFASYTPPMESAGNRQEFAEIAGKMLAGARDMHLWVKIDGKTVNGFKREVERNYDLKYLARTVPRWRERNAYVCTGRFDDGIGYILIKSWAGKTDDDYAPVFEALREFADCRGLVIDVRPNAGGSESWGAKVAGCFIDKQAIYAKHAYRQANRPGGWGDVQDRVLKPNPDGPRFRGKVAVLMGQACMSSCEGFLLMMRQVPGCVLVGDKSYGASGNPKPYELGNGVTVWLPSWKPMQADGTGFETRGIMPDKRITVTRDQLGRSDPVLEAALAYLR